MICSPFIAITLRIYVVNIIVVSLIFICILLILFILLSICMKKLYRLF